MKTIKASPTAVTTPSNAIEELRSLTNMPSPARLAPSERDRCRILENTLESIDHAGNRWEDKG
jgi:hypothetical protein